MMERADAGDWTDKWDTDTYARHGGMISESVAG